MKVNIKITALIIILNITSVMISKQVCAQQTNVSYQVFYDELSPYGQWINNPDYGYVWIPNAGADFAPYSTGGHWILTDYGWTWVSDYSWGWAPFHYGRWDYDNSYGWLWIPGYDWGPAWVTWRSCNGYYGWAPIDPGVGLYTSFGRPYNGHGDHWMFIKDRDIERTDLQHYYVNRSSNDRLIRSSTVINKTSFDSKRHAVYISGPAREDVQKITGKKITPVIIHENTKPGQNMSNGQLQIYRPQVQKNNNNTHKPAPKSVVALKDVKKPSERKTTNPTKSVTPPVNNRNIQPKSTKPPINNRQQPQRVTNPQNNNKQQQPRTANPPVNRQQQQPKAQNPQVNRQQQQPKTQNQPRQQSHPQNNNRQQQPRMQTPPSNNREEHAPNK